MDLLIVVQAGPKIRAAAGGDFRVGPDGDLLGGTEGHSADADVAPEFGLIRTHQPSWREKSVAGVSPDITIAAAQGEFRRGVVEDVDLFLTVVGHQRGSQ